MLNILLIRNAADLDDYGFPRRNLTQQIADADLVLDLRFGEPQVVKYRYDVSEQITVVQA